MNRARCSLLLLLATAMSPAVTRAQEIVDRQGPLFGIGSFLTQDEKLNYDLGLEGTLAAESALTSRLQLRLGLAFLTAPLKESGGDPDDFPLIPDGLKHAFALRATVHTYQPGAGLYALAGVEGIAGFAGNQGNGIGAGASVGVGLKWRAGSPFALETQYTIFGQRLGTTRGLVIARVVRSL